jgi:VIT1/CCC1 family predicted Fe2+/Mn2+ transporter
MGRIKGAAVGVAVLGMLLLSGCGADGGEDASSTGAAAPVQDSDGKAANTAPQEPGAPSGQSKPGQPRSEQAQNGQVQNGQAQPSVTRAIIKTGSLTIEGADVAELRQQAITVITSLDGQVASEDTGSNADGDSSTANLVLKVPAKSYETAIQRLYRIGTCLQLRQESSDVTEQVVDVTSRIESQRAGLDRMRALMAKANTVGEIVSVESELTRREADLESLLAKQKNLSLQTELATLTLTLTEKGKPPAMTEDPDRGGFLAGLKGGWNAFTATFSALATAFGAVLPFLILLAIICAPLWRFRHRLRRRPAAPDSGQ